MTPERQSKMFELLSTGSDDPVLKAEAALEHISGYLQLEIEDNAKLRAVVVDMLAGLAYLRSTNSIPYGFGIDRLEQTGRAALGDD